MAKETASLEMDVKQLLADVLAGDFHDFKSDVYATPKIALVKRLEELIENVKQGKYDDTYDG